MLFKVRVALMRTFVILGYYLGIMNFFYWLNRKAKRIIVFHNVLPDDIMKSEKNSGAISFSAFKDIIAQCLYRYKPSVDFSDEQTITFTFDDGYLNQYEVVHKYLLGIGVPGVVFVAQQEEYPLVIDQLRYWQKYVPDNVVATRNKQVLWDKKIWPAYKSDVAGFGKAAVKLCESVFSFSDLRTRMSDRHYRLRFDPIPCEKLDEMRQNGWRIGWHTKHHYPLIGLSNDVLRDELTPPPSFENEALSYPYGADGWMDERAVKIVEEMITPPPCAVSNCLISKQPFTRYYMPRIHLSEDKYRLHYELSGLGHFLRTRKLLPAVKFERRTNYD